jgi:hypothetical protein
MTQCSSNKALDFMFFVAEVSKADASDLEAASILAESKLRKGSRIDVFVEDQFWAARITTVHKNGFTFRYCCKYSVGGGFVKRKHFLTKWRFPVETARQVVFAEALQKKITIPVV